MESINFSEQCWHKEGYPSPLETSTDKQSQVEPIKDMASRPLLSIFPTSPQISDHNASLRISLNLGQGGFTILDGSTSPVGDW